MRLTPAMELKYWPLGYDEQAGIAAAPDGGAWTTSAVGNGLFRVAADEILDAFSEPKYTSPAPITAGPDGAMWFGDGGSTIRRITSTGAVQNFHAGGEDLAIVSITTGPDGNLWYTKFKPGVAVGGIRSRGGEIVRMSPSGSPTVFKPAVTKDLLPTQIIPGPDGALWFSTVGGLGRITTDGRITEMNLPGGRVADSLAFGRDGAIWFTDARLNRISRIKVAEARALARSVAPKIASKTLRVKKRKVRVKIACPADAGKCTGKVLVRRKKAKLAKGRYSVPGGKTKAAKAKLRAKGKALVKRSSSVKVVVELRPADGGAEVRRKAKLKG
ncbi:MAG: hypothetical protein GEU88_13625 [Solirubrobacterales bacterium]|nr:hypothetical protein [Solirubrobacterales bacterium]